jgi:hypothetical protein
MRLFVARHVAYDCKTLQPSDIGKIQLSHLCRLIKPFFTLPATMMTSNAPWVQSTATIFAQEMGGDLFSYLEMALNAPLMHRESANAITAVALRAQNSPDCQSLAVFTHQEFASEIAGAMFCHLCGKSILLPDLDLGAAWMIDTNQKTISLLDFRKQFEVFIFESV